MLCCRISELEHKIGAGLIEEVIQVAEGELQLIDRMEQASANLVLELTDPATQH